MSKEIDYKKAGQKRTRCVQCGRLGVYINRHGNNTSEMRHKYKKGMLGFIEITDICFLTEMENLHQR